ncbi:MAG: VOC family protein, partial [Bacteroidetes bacterium]|nr:VOC family protein [Bacteroidota bacterium]
VTVGPKDQPDLEIILMKVQPGPFTDEETASTLKDLVQKGAMGTGVFDTNDCHATYEELSAKGVEFIRPPQTQEYGTEALFKDNSGNWFSLVQRPG